MYAAHFNTTIQKGKSLLMKKRNEKDIWHGLYDFYLIEKNRLANVDKIIAEDKFLRKISKEKKLIGTSEIYKHVLSHQIIYSRFIQLRLPESSALNGTGLKFYSKKKIAELPKPVLVSRFLSDQQLL